VFRFHFLCEFNDDDDADHDDDDDVLYYNCSQTATAYKGQSDKTASCHAEQHDTIEHREPVLAYNLYFVLYFNLSYPPHEGH